MSEVIITTEKYEYYMNVNQHDAIGLGIKNINQAHVFDLLTKASVWAKPQIIDGEVYYWVARQKICTQLPILGLKPDTAYRHLKFLADIGVIVYKKLGKKDCIQLTDLGRSYGQTTYVGNRSENTNLPMSEIDPKNTTNSEIDPVELGNESEYDSEMNPTYYTTNTNKIIKDKTTAACEFGPLGKIRDHNLTVPPQLPSGLTKEVVDAFILHRIDANKPLNQPAMQSMLQSANRLAMDNGITGDDVLNLTVANGWITFDHQGFQRKLRDSRSKPNSGNNGTWHQPSPSIDTDIPFSERVAQLARDTMGAAQ